MAQPTPYELKLLGKIIITKEKLKAFRKEHTISCPAADPTGMPAKCTCSATEHNEKIDQITAELNIE